MSSATSEITIEGRRVALSNLEKTMYPRADFTKGAVIDYYIKIAPVLLPHLAGRPLTLKRYPDGVEGPFFYEKECPSHRPTWVKTKRVESHNASGEVNYCVPNGLPSLVWVANLASLELHTFLHKAKALTQPTAVAFDLDPGPPATIVDCCRVALRLRSVLHGLDLESFPKTSGSKGLQLYAPLNTRASYDRTKAFAHAMALHLESEMPDLVVSRMEKARRKGKVFIDWSQNDDHKTTVCVYSLRAKDRATVSTPVTWDEVTKAAESDEVLSFTSDEVLKRVATRGDLFEPVLSLKQKVPGKALAAA